MEFFSIKFSNKLIKKSNNEHIQNPYVLFFLTALHMCMCTSTCTLSVYACTHMGDCEMLFKSCRLCSCSAAVAGEHTGMTVDKSLISNQNEKTAGKEIVS